MSQGPRRISLMKINEDKKSRGTVPLIEKFIQCHFGATAKDSS
jgi:hypothetical protein